MAEDPKAPGTGAAPPAEPAKREVPSFSAVVEETRDARAAELADLAGVSAVEKKPDAPADKVEAYDFDAEWSKVPERLRTEAAQRLYDGYNAALSQEYGDVLPLIIEAKGSPALREALALAAKDPSFRDLLADADFRKGFNKLTDKQQREFLLGEASDTYAKYAAPAAGERTPEKDPREARIEALETKFSQQTDERETGSYIADRQREVQALASKYPELVQDQKLLGHVVEIAEQRFEAAALRAGIKTTDNPGWPAQAKRAGIAAPSYLEAYQYQAEVSGRTTPPAAPATSPVRDPARPQAPRDAAEGKKRGLELVKKAGGFNGLAAAASRRGR